MLPRGGTKVNNGKTKGSNAHRGISPSFWKVVVVMEEQREEEFLVVPLFCFSFDSCTDKAEIYARKLMAVIKTLVRLCVGFSSCIGPILSICIKLWFSLIVKKI